MTHAFIIFSTLRCDVGHFVEKNGKGNLRITKVINEIESLEKNFQNWGLKWYAIGVSPDSIPQGPVMVSLQILPCLVLEGLADNGNTKLS